MFALNSRLMSLLVEHQKRTSLSLRYSGKCRHRINNGSFRLLSNSIYILFSEWRLTFSCRNLVNSPSQWTLMQEHDVAVFHLINYGPEAGQKKHYVSRSDRMVRRVIMKKVPRPLNSFILYRKDRQEIVKEEHPDLTNNQICESKAADTSLCTSLTK